MHVKCVKVKYMNCHITLYSNTTSKIII